MEFNWVKAHRECSGSKVFQQLCMGIKADIDAIDDFHQERIRAAGTGTKPKFEIRTEATRAIVTRTIRSTTASVEFAVKQNNISAEGHGFTLITVTVDLNQAQQCVLTLDGREVEQWQVRRMTLQHLFFDEDWL